MAVKTFRGKSAKQILEAAFLDKDEHGVPRLRTTIGGSTHKVARYNEAKDYIERAERSGSV